MSSLDGGEAKVNERADGLSDSLDTLVSHVKELLPHLGDGFIEVGTLYCVCVYMGM